ncbi:hypothetical protein Syun_009446 [Stephania yunnanensis]|uniref:Uncharacterized protein n=1 Tax=Stephania yunnanensis TaxID=152371 RepID=A0AAP0KEN2_9MAGN
MTNLELNEAGTRLGDPPARSTTFRGFSMEHSDVDVKVAAASCVSEITRINVPDAPFEDEQMRELLDTFTARQMGKVFCTNSGSEANDSQLMLFAGLCVDSCDNYNHLYKPSFT